MAGEFAFSISLTLSILDLGVAVRGLRTGRYRALAAALFALAGLCHLIPAFFVLACTFALSPAYADRARLRWMATHGLVAGLLTAFWVLPFWWRRDYVNDMGWERLPIPKHAERGRRGASPSDQQSVLYYLFPNGLKYLFVAAAVGVVISAVRRYRIGLVLGFAWFAVALAFWLMPQYRLLERSAPALPVPVGVAARRDRRGRAAASRRDGGERGTRPPVPADHRPGGDRTARWARLSRVAMPVQDVAEGRVRDRRRGVAAIEREPVTATERSTTRARRPPRPSTRRVPPVRHLALLRRDNNSVSGWAAWNYSGSSRSSRRAGHARPRAPG